MAMSPLRPLETFSDALTGGDYFLASVSPGLGSTRDLLDIVRRSREAVGPLGAYLDRSSKNERLALVIFDGINLCQIDNVLVPLFNDVTSGTTRILFSAEQKAFPTRLGMWPANVLIAGTLVTSELALPSSQRMWHYSPASSVAWWKSRAGSPALILSNHGRHAPVLPSVPGEPVPRPVHDP
jgi:hypothetical protein